MVEKVAVQCGKCYHIWNTKSQYCFVSCPSCNQKVRIREIITPEELNIEDDNGTGDNREVN